MKKESLNSNGLKQVAIALAALAYFGAVIYGDYTKVKEGASVRATGRVLSVPVGDANVAPVIRLARPKSALKIHCHSRATATPAMVAWIPEARTPTQAPTASTT